MSAIIGIAIVNEADELRELTGDEQFSDREKRVHVQRIHSTLQVGGG